MKCNVNIPEACPFCGRQLQQESKDFALLDEQSKPIGKFCHIYWRHPTTTDCILGDCNVTYEPDGIERTQGYSFSNTPDEIRKWNKRSLSQKELAYRLGTDFQVVSLYERGGIMPGIEAIRKFAEALGVSAGYLVDRMPPRRVDVCPCCGAKLEPRKGGVRYELPRVSGAEN